MPTTNVLIPIRLALILAIYLLFITPTSHAQTFVHIPLPSDQSIIRHMDGFNNFIFFNFTVGNSLKPDQDLLFTVSPLDWISNPDILISAINPFPTEVNQGEYFCWMFGSDICPIPASHLTVNKTFFITVYCPYTCSFSIKAHLETKKVLELNKKKSLLFNAEESAEGQVLQLTIPKDFQSDHIVLQAIPRDFESLNHSIAMYINKGDITPNANAFMAQGLPSWHGGVSFSFKSGMDIYCTECVYTILLATKDDIMVDVLAREKSHEMQLELKTRLYDFSFEGQIILYHLEINGSSIRNYKNRDVVIELRPYYGNPDLYVNLNTRPDTLESYKWSSNEFGIESLRISPEELIASRTSDDGIDNFYIAVNSVRAATFSILAYIENKRQKPVDFGIAETGYVQKGEIDTYILEVPAQSEGQYTLTVTLHTLSGNPDLYVKSCPSNFAEQQQQKTKLAICEVSEEDINQYNQDIMSNETSSQAFFVGSKRTTGNEQLVFLNGPPACTLTSGDCLYAIGVHGNPETKTNSHYSVLAIHSTVHTILQEQIPIKHNVMIGEYMYYKFVVFDDSHTLSVHFQRTPISGEAGIFSSKTEQYPSINNYEKTACFCAHIITYCGFNPKDKPLQATYYIAVYGFSHATYTITAITRSSIGPSVIQLMESVPHRFVFPSTGEALQEAFFRFRIDFDPSIETDLHINLTPLKGGHYKIRVAEGYLPNDHTAIWTSTNNKLTISSKDLQYVSNANYFVSVIPYDPADPTKKDFDTKKWQFTIQYYSSSNKIQELVEGHAILGTVATEKPAFFRLAVNKNDKEVHIKLTQFGKPLTLYVSTSDENPFPGIDNQDYTGESSITLSAEDITKFCYEDKKQQMTGSHCPIYVGVYTNDESANTDQEFSIVVEKPSTLIFLQEGLPDSHEVPEEGSHVDYVILPKKGEDINLSLSSKAALSVYITVVDTKAHPHSSEWQAEESEDTLVKDEKEHYGEDIVTVKASKWEQYEESIVIIRIKSTRAEEKDSKYTLTYVGNLNVLMDSHVVFGRVQSGSYHYYKLEAGKGETKLLKIFLTPLTSGLPELYLASSDSNPLPTKDTYQYKSQDPSNPSISLEEAKGSYYLAVYSPNNCSYSLVFTTHPETFIDVHGNVPISVTSAPKHEEGVYLVCRPSEQNDFKVLYSKEAGNPELYLSPMYQDSEGKDNELPTNKTYQHSSVEEEGIISVKTAKGQGNVAEYMIFVKNDGCCMENKATVIVSEKGQYAHLPSGKTFKDKVEEGDINHYYYVSQDLAEDEHVEISLVSYNGNPEIVASVYPDVETRPLWTASQTPDKKGSSIELKILRDNMVETAPQPDGRVPPPGIKEGQAVLSKGQTLFIGVKGKTGSLYDIRINVGKRTMSLEDGIISTGLLKGPESKKFTFHSSYDSVDNKLITLVLTVLSSNNNDQVHMFPELEIEYVPASMAVAKEDSKKKDYYVESHIETRSGQTSRIYRFVAKKALYMIKLSMKMEIAITYSLNLNVNGLIALPPNNEMLGYLKEGTTDTYQISVNTPGNLLVQVFECFGKSTVSLAPTREAYLSGEFSSEIQKSISENGYGLIPVNPGQVYLQVKALEGWLMFTPLAAEGIKGLESAYKLTVYFLPTSQLPPQNFIVPGDHGKVEARRIEPTKYHLEWKNLEITPPNEKKTTKESDEVFDIVYFSKSQKALNMASKCQIIPGSEMVFTIEHGEDISVYSVPVMAKLQEKTISRDIDLNTTVMMDQAPLFVTVTSRIQSSFPQQHQGSPSITVPMFYERTEVKEPPGIMAYFEQIKNTPWMIEIIVGAIVMTFGLVVGCLIWRCMKNRTNYTEIPKKFNYELGKVQEEGSSEKKVKYEELEDEENSGHEQSP